MRMHCEPSDGRETTLEGLASRGKSWYDAVIRGNSGLKLRRQNVDPPTLIPTAYTSPLLGRARACRAARRKDIFEWGEVTMVGSIRRVRVTLAFLAIDCSAGRVFAGCVGSATISPRRRRRRSLPRITNGKRLPASRVRSRTLGPRSSRRSRSLEMIPPQPFVPLRPATVEDRRRTEVLRLFGAARALEDRRQWSDAAALLQEALKIDPDSVAIARRLSRIYVGALARPDLAVQYSKRVLAAEPS